MEDGSVRTCRWTSIRYIEAQRAEAFLLVSSIHKKMCEENLLGYTGSGLHFLIVLLSGHPKLSKSYLFYILIWWLVVRDPCFFELKLFLLSSIIKLNW